MARAQDATSGRSDAENQRLIWKAAARRGDALWVIPLLVASLAAAAAAVAGWHFLRLIQLAFAPAGAPAPTPINPLPAGGAALAPFGGPARGLSDPARVALVFGVMAVFIAAWTLARRTMIHRTIRRLVNRVACPACEFSIVGLRPRGAFVTCPECGHCFDLYAHGLSPDDLKTEAEKRRPFEGAGRFGAYKSPAAKRR